MRVLSIAALLALGALALAGCANSPAGTSTVTPTASSSSDPASTPGIAARGKGKVMGTPDTVTVQLGVETRGPNAKAALDDNSAKANALITMLKGKGVAEKDLQTSQLSVYPTFDTAGRRITGYQVNNMVTATIRDIAAAGGIIDAAGAAAGDNVRVSQLSFSIADDSTLLAQARADAVKKAQAQAKQMADAAGVPLGKLRSIREVVSNSSQPYPAGAAADRAALQAAPVLPGSEELTVSVDVVYDVG